jgi:hypothetical protein
MLRKIHKDINYSNMFWHQKKKIDRKQFEKVHSTLHTLPTVLTVIVSEYAYEEKPVKNKIDFLNLLSFISVSFAPLIRFQPIISIPTLKDNHIGCKI